MNDVVLWNRLRAGSTGDEVAAMLDALAEAPIAPRAPLFGAVLPLLQHESANVRRGAIRFLTGADGHFARTEAARALDDEIPDVRSSATSTFVHSIRRDPDRFLHALFHRHSDVREIALALTEHLPSAWQAAYLFDDPGADPANLLEVLTGKPIPGILLRPLLDFARDGRLSPSNAVRLLAQASWVNPLELLPSLAHLPSSFYNDTIAEAIKQARANRSTKPLQALDSPEIQVLTGVFTIALNAPPADSEPLIQSIRKHYLAWDLRYRPLLAIAVLKTAGFDRSPALLRALLLFLPETIAFVDIDRDARREASEVHYEEGNRLPTKQPPWVMELIADTDICRRTKSGALDLEVIGGLLYYIRDRPYHCLVNRFGEEAVVAAALEDLDATLKFLCHSDAGKKGQAWLIRKIADRRGQHRGVLLSALVLRLPANELAMLGDLSRRQTLNLIQHLFDRLEKLPNAGSEKKLTTLAERLLSRLESQDHPKWITWWLDHTAPEQNRLARALFTESARRLETDAFVDLVLGFRTPKSVRLLNLFPYCSGIPYGKEMALANRLAKAIEPGLRKWAKSRLPPADASPSKMPSLLSRLAAKASGSETRRVETCSDRDLESAVEPFIGRHAPGICQALEKRRPFPSVPVCIALLSSADPLDAVDREMARWSSDTSDFLKRLDQDARRHLQRKTIHPFGHAWLHLWEWHVFAFGDWVEADAQGFANTLGIPPQLDSRTLGEAIWRTVARLFAIWRLRDKDRLWNHIDDAVFEVALDGLRRPWARSAADILVTLHRFGQHPGSMRSARGVISRLLPDLDEELRRRLDPIVSSEGLPASSPATAKPARPKPDLSHVDSGDGGLEDLRSRLLSGQAEEIEAAAQRLLELGAEEHLARTLIEHPCRLIAQAVADRLAAWRHEPYLEKLREAARDLKIDPGVRYFLSRGFVERGESAFLPLALDLLVDSSPPHWFRPEEWTRLANLIPERDLARKLARSPQPHAYRPAVESLALEPALDDDAVSALRDFIQADGERARGVRIWAAERLHRDAHFDGLPVLLRACFEEKAGEHFLELKPEELLDDLPLAEARMAVDAVLVAGPVRASERLLVDWLKRPSVSMDVRNELVPYVFENVQRDDVRQHFLGTLRRQMGRNPRLARLADTFAWGVKTGRELTGTLFRIDMPGDEALGYTRLNENRIWITPLLIMRSEPRSVEATRGLIVHEFGHHLYHKGPKADRIWKRADEEGLGRLLNIVTDEHLERRLRSERAEFGDDLKALGAYAFQHADRTVRIRDLLGTLGSFSFSVLNRTPLRVARRPASVIIESGRILREMERCGMSFARFFRALRLGLGNRHGDPKVAEALELFKGRFRLLNMASLYEITLKLREIFGDETEVLSLMGEAHDAGSDQSEAIIRTGGLTGDELQSEIERVLRGQNAPASDGTHPASRGTSGGIRLLNDGSEETFTKITTVIPVAYDPAAADEYARPVARPARKLREVFETLGLNFHPTGPRTSGRTLARQRLRPLLIYGEPRIMTARKLQISADLFLAVIIDCSGSMAYGEHLDEAKQFGALLAEATRGMRGVDARFFGFTDSVIYDAGDANRCAVHGLEASGGNNDAAALWHAAQVAKHSRRRTKVLVMISDGLPTECSTTSLRSLVVQLSKRHGMCCAQVAVQSLSEICFPHYVEIVGLEENQRVKRFGQIVAKLVNRTLGPA